MAEASTSGSGAIPPNSCTCRAPRWSAWPRQRDWVRFVKTPRLARFLRNQANFPDRRCHHPRDRRTGSLTMSRIWKCTARSKQQLCGSRLLKARPPFLRNEANSAVAIQSVEPLFRSSRTGGRPLYIGPEAISSLARPRLAMTNWRTRHRRACSRPLYRYLVHPISGSLALCCVARPSDTGSRSPRSWGNT
jgi:hypothetical protein